MLHLPEQAFFVGRGGGDDAGTWLDGTPGQTEGGSFGQILMASVTHKLQYLYLFLN